MNAVLLPTLRTVMQFGPHRTQRFTECPHEFHRLGVGP